MTNALVYFILISRSLRDRGAGFLVDEDLRRKVVLEKREMNGVNGFSFLFFDQFGDNVQRATEGKVCSKVTKESAIYNIERKDETGGV